MAKRISEDVRNSICNAYMEKSKLTLVAEEFGVNEKTVRNILRERGIKSTPRELRNKKYDFDLDYFKNIDSKEKAYMLGFVYGDGAVKKDQLAIEIATKDEEVLEMFRGFVGSNSPPIKRRVRERKGTTTCSSTLHLCGHKFVEPLIKLGLLGSKSKTIRFPDVYYKFDFLRGLSDSDGCVRVDKKNRGYWSIISSIEMCKDIENVLLTHDIESRVINTQYDGLGRVVITKKSEIIKLRSYLYGKDCVCLERKMDTFFNVFYKKGGEG